MLIHFLENLQPQEEIGYTKYAINLQNNGALSLPERIQRIWKLPNIVSAKIIDFELSTSKDDFFQSKAIENNDMQNNLLLDDYGLIKNECAVFDVHLLLYDSLISAEKNTAVHEKLKEFSEKFIPSKYFDKAFLTKQCRLKKDDQDKLHKELGPLLIPRMLSDSYFFDFRRPSDCHPDFEI